MVSTRSRVNPRPDNVPLALRNYHDLEHRSLGTPIEQTKKENAFGVRVTTVTSNTTLVGKHDLVLVDCTGGEIIITVPAAANHPYKQFRIKKIDTTGNKVKVIYYSLYTTLAHEEQ